MRVAPAVILSPEERARLERWSRPRRETDVRGLRSRIVLRAADGLRDTEIGAELGVSRLTVARWRKRFLRARLHAVEALTQATPRSSRIGEERVRAIVLAAGGRNSARGAPWSTRSLADRLGVSHTTVRRIWQTHQVRPERTARLPARADPRPSLEPVDVVGVFLGGEDRALVFALGPAAPGRGPVRGSPTDGLGRLVARLGPLAPDRSTAASSDLLRFLDRLTLRLGRSAPITVVVVPPGVARSGAFDAWRGHHPAVRLELLPDLGHWEQRVGVRLKEVAGRPARAGRGSGRSELARALRLFLATYRPESGPFEWVAATTDATREVAGDRLRYDLSVTGHEGFKKAPGLVPTVAPPSVPDPHVRAMARLVLRRSLRVRAGERVTVLTWSETLPVANAFVLETLRLGARPLLLFQDEPTYWAATTEVPPSSLAHVGDHLKAALRRSDALVSFFGPSDRERFHALPYRVRSRLGEYEDDLYAAAARGGARAVQLALGRASPSSARMYGVDLATWRDELVAASLVEPAKLVGRARRVAALLRSGTEVRLRHPNGTDLRLGLRHRPPQVSDGRVPAAAARGSWNLVQLPAGVVTVALDEGVAEGTFRSNVPNSIGVMDTIAEVADGRWQFAGGRLRRFSYAEGGEAFAQSYDRAGSGRDRPATLSIGLNERIAISPLLLDQGIGTVTLQIGRNEPAGGATRTYWWAWLILRGADVSVDGTPLVRAGKLVP